MIRKGAIYLHKGGALSLESIKQHPMDSQAKAITNPASLNVGLGTGTDILSKSPFEKTAPSVPAITYGAGVLQGLEKMKFRQRGRPKNIQLNLLKT